MPDRGPASYISEFLGTLLLVFSVSIVVSLYVAHGDQAAQFGSDFAVVGLVHAFILFILIAIFGGASGGHFNPAVTFAVFLLRRIKGIDAAIYVLVQLSGGVAGALLCKAFLLDEGRAGDYGAVTVSPLLGGAFQGALIEGIGTFVLILVICSVAIDPRKPTEWAPLAIGMTLGAIVMLFGPLTGGSFNPARWFGPALVGDEFGKVWPYVVGPLAGALLAAGVYLKVIVPGEETMINPPAGPG